MAIGRKDWFVLDPKPIYLTHGNFGGCLKVAFDNRLYWHQKLEFNPHKFLVYDLFPELQKSRLSLSRYLDCNKDDLVYFNNPSTALNTVIRSLNLKKNDEVLSTNHEYGALDKTWQYYSEKKEFNYKKINIDLPFDDSQLFVQNFINSINKKTKVIFLSHITSSTALIFPVKEICKIAKENNILTIIDGAHTPGHIKLSIRDIDPDIYVGACHKWICSPKGVSFLYSSKSYQKNIDPLVISWGWRDKLFSKESQFINWHQWQGTNDLSAYLTIPVILDFFKKHDWNKVSTKCHDLILETKNYFSNSNSICIPTSNNSNHLGQMLSFKVNQDSKLIQVLKNDPTKISEVQKTIFNQSNIYMPIIIWNDEIFMRVSIQAYNSKKDIESMFEMLDQFNLL